jgi:hypothetical protein
MKRRCFQILAPGIVICLSLVLQSCSSTPERTSRSPDPGVLKKEAKEEFKFKLGKPEPLQENNVDRYDKRNSGALEGLGVGVNGTWRF